MDFNKFRYKLYDFFKDRYGWDRLSKYLYIAGAILFISRWTMLPGLGLVAYSTWRSLSKDRYKRYLEAQAFETYLLKFKNSFSGVKYRLTEGRAYKIFTCPNCSQKLRVPRHKGKITISCKKCGTEFKGKS